MGRGIAVWTMSKIVMLIFLFLVFSSVIMYTQLLNQRAIADAAQSVTMQIKSTLTAVVSSEAFDATLAVPLPSEIPEKTKGVYGTTEAPLRPYILRTIIDRIEGNIVFAISLDNGNSFVSASLLVLPGAERGVSHYWLDSTNKHVSTFDVDSRVQSVYFIEKITDLNTEETFVYLRASDIKGGDCVGGCIGVGP